MMVAIRLDSIEALRDRGAPLLVFMISIREWLADMGEENPSAEISGRSSLLLGHGREKRSADPAPAELQDLSSCFSQTGITNRAALFSCRFELL